MPREGNGSRRDDAGFGLVELMVSMSIASVVGAIVTAGILQIYRTSRITESRSVTQAALSQVLLRLDHEVRYAGYIGATTTGQTSVTYLLDSTCVQLRLSGAQLQRRTWTAGAGAASPTTWQPIASQVASDTPFTRADGNRQQLTVDLTAVDGSARKHSVITFTALNTDPDTGATADPCDDPRTQT
jgi:prepilin-type N-terminal cleavage/methylation domain-containing protein